MRKYGKWISILFGVLLLAQPVSAEVYLGDKDFSIELDLIFDSKQLKLSKKKRKHCRVVRLPLVEKAIAKCKGKVIQLPSYLSEVTYRVRVPEEEELRCIKAVEQHYPFVRILKNPSWYELRKKGSKRTGSKIVGAVSVSFAGSIDPKEAEQIIWKHGGRPGALRGRFLTAYVREGCEEAVSERIKLHPKVELAYQKRRAGPRERRRKVGPKRPK